MSSTFNGMTLFLKTSYPLKSCKSYSELLNIREQGCHVIYLFVLNKLSPLTKIEEDVELKKKFSLNKPQLI